MLTFVIRIQAKNSEVPVANFDQKSLKALKKQLLEKQQQEKLREQQAQQKQIEQQQNQLSFQDAMSNVRPLSNENVVHNLEKPKAKRLQHNDSEDEFEVDDPLSDELEIVEIGREEILSFCRSGIQHKVFKKLRSGSYTISDELDLHGASIKQAKQILIFYLQQAEQYEGCCIRIIHGKGHRSEALKAVLKTYVNHWLREHERVLAFHTTKTRDGGTGALYVLLKR